MRRYILPRLAVATCRSTHAFLVIIYSSLTCSAQLSDVPISVTVLRTEVLETNTIPNFKELVSSVSISIDRNEVPSSNIRGMRINQGVELLNGVQVFPPGSIENIEVLRGPTSEVNGRDVYQGVFTMPLSGSIPSNVDLRPAFQVTDGYGRLSWRGTSGDPFMKPDDGIPNAPM